MIAPGEFIDKIERSELIKPLTFEVVRLSMAAYAQLESAGIDIELSINLSVRVLHDKRWLSKIVDCIQETQIDPEKICFELTETLQVTDSEMAREHLMYLSKVGFGLSIDDFGTGYSSMEYLSRLPFRELKIDQRFIKDMVADKQSFSITKKIIELAQMLGLITVAEGVETEATVALLSQIGCDIAQGYFISKPLPFDAFVEYLKGNQTTC